MAANEREHENQLPEELRDDVPHVVAPHEEEQTLNIHDLPSANIDRAPVEGLETFKTEETDLPADGPKVKAEGGKLIFDRQEVENAQAAVIADLKAAIESGNEAEVERYLWYLEDHDDELTKSAIEAVREALKNRSAEGLNFLNVNPNEASPTLQAVDIALPFRSMAERKLIKEAIRAELTKYPILNPDRTPLNFDTVDAALIQQGDHFELIIASKQGIPGIAFQEKVNPDQFQIDIHKASAEAAKASKPRTLILPVGASAKGDQPLASIIRVVINPIDLPASLMQMEQEWEQKKKQEIREREEDERNRAARAGYTPTPPSAPSSSYTPRQSRPTSWTSSN